MKPKKAGREPSSPTKKRRVGADGYEVITLLLWMFLFIGGLAVFLLASNNASLLDTTMTLEKNTPLLLTVFTLWLALSYVLIRFDATAQARALERYEEEVTLYERNHASWTDRIEAAITSKVKGKTKGWLSFGSGSRRTDSAATAEQVAGETRSTDDEAAADDEASAAEDESEET